MMSIRNGSCAGIAALIVLALIGDLAAAAPPDWDQVVTKLWVGPLYDRLALVMPWDGNRPDPGAVCPAGETRQVWLDLDGHRLTPGTYTFWVVLKAGEPERARTGDDKVIGDLAGDLEAEIRDQAIANPASATAVRQRKFLTTIAAEESKRNYWYHWVDNLNYVRKPLARQPAFADLVKAVPADQPLPLFVVWTPCKWTDFPPTILPPSLASVTAAPPVELALDEYEPVCLTLSNLTDGPLKFTITLAAAAPPAAPPRPDTVVVQVPVTVWPLRLPEKSRFEVYTWNYGMSDREHLAFLKRMKVNWFSINNPAFKVAGDQLTCDFKDTDPELDTVRDFGKAMFIYSAVNEFNQKLDKETGIKRDDPRNRPLLREYLTQWVRHVQAKGWKPEDYAIELWDEPGQEGYHDQDWVFNLIAEAATIMKEVEPKIQIMENPLMRFHRNWYDVLAPHVSIWCPYGGLLYLTDNTQAKTWDDVKGLRPTDFAESNLMTQVYLRQLRQQRGCRRWTYFQRDAKVQNGIVYFRHFPWKNKWMGLEGVSFWGSWYATGGALEKPNYQGTRDWVKYAIKGLYGWRDGVEDIQYLELLEDAIAQQRAADPAKATALQQVGDQAQQRVAATGWWAATPEVLDTAITDARRDLVRALSPR